MDEMRMKLSTRFMRNIVSRLIAKAVYHKTGYKVDIQIKELDVSIIDGETNISTNVDVKLKSSEFTKLMKSIGED